MINNLTARIERLKNNLKKEIQVCEDDTPRGCASRNKGICNNCIIYYINRKGAECDTNYILWLALTWWDILLLIPFMEMEMARQRVVDIKWKVEDRKVNK